MTHEWADDKGTREDIFVRCIKCGWDGAGEMITQYGCSDWIPERCPLCNMETEVDERGFKEDKENEDD